MKLTKYDSYGIKIHRYNVSTNNRLAFIHCSRVIVFPKFFYLFMAVRRRKKCVLILHILFLTFNCLDLYLEHIRDVIFIVEHKRSLVLKLQRVILYFFLLSTCLVPTCILCCLPSLSQEFSHLTASSCNNHD